MKPSIVTSAFTLTLVALGLLLMGCSIRPAPGYYYEDPDVWESYHEYGSSDVMPLDEMDDDYFLPYEPYYSPWSMSTYYHHIPPYPIFHDKSYQGYEGSKGSYQPYPNPNQTDADKNRVKRREFSDHTQRERYRSRVSDSESTAQSLSQPSQDNSDSTSTPNSNYPNYIEDENLKRLQEEMRIREAIRERQRLREPKASSQVERNQSQQRQRMRSRER
jgi:hypothetical protein